jgi:histidinol dehydrogenase
VLRFRGKLSALAEASRRRLLDRTTSSDDAIRRRTEGIIARVRKDGDAALVQMAAEFDKAQLTSLEVPRRHWRDALAGLPSPLRAALERAARNIAKAHEAFLPKPLEVETEPGVFVGRRPDPLSRVGVYAPGGRAAYPSSVLMGAVPARVAGVAEVILCSPPSPSGLPTPVVLAAAELAKVDRVFAIGGAGAIAAMAYGTASVPRVDRIVGPGNAYVAEAKTQVAGAVATDSPAGPSELLALCDDSADLNAVAREMLAQAEHDPRACVVALVLGEGTAARLETALDAALAAQPRKEIITESLAFLGAILEVESLDEAVPFANLFAGEHTLVALRGADAVLSRLRNQGTVFLGETSSVAFGDYMTGSNHVLPTGGLARSYSGLSTLDFMRWTSYQRVERAAAARLAEDVGVLADSEGLAAHAAAARAWKERRDDP